VPTATPDTLVQALAQFVVTAAEQAANQPAQIAQALDTAFAQVADATQDIATLPNDARSQLDRAVDDLDWSSLLVYVLLQISELDDHLSVGALAARDGWSRAVALTYRVSDAADAPSATVALALTDPGRVHGVIFRVAGLEHVSFTKRKVTVSLGGQSNGEWRIRFDGGVSKPQTEAKMHASIAYGPVQRLAENAPIGIGLGSARVAVALSNEDPIWRVDVTLGSEDEVPALEARATFTDSLGPLAALLDIESIGKRYSPALTASAVAEPSFTLGRSR
jgi:hypothetical protein